MPPTVILLRNSGRSLLHFIRIPRVLGNSYFITYSRTCDLNWIDLWHTVRVLSYTKFHGYINALETGLKFMSVYRCESVNVKTKKFLHQSLIVRRNDRRKKTFGEYRDKEDSVLKIVTKKFCMRTIFSYC